MGPCAERVRRGEGSAATLVCRTGAGARRAQQRGEEPLPALALVARREEVCVLLEQLAFSQTKRNKNENENARR